MSTELSQAAQAFLQYPSTVMEHALIKLARATNPEISDAAFVEYGCVEHAVIHIHDQGTWYEIDPNNGRILRC
jgi:hypothetical protein